MIVPAIVGLNKEIEMKKLLAIGGLALALSGCQSITQAWDVATSTSVPAQYALAAANSFDAIEAVATGYLQLPPCGGTVVVCRNSAAAAKIIPAVRSGRAARNSIEGLLNANSGAAIPVASYNTLEASISTLQSIYTQYNVSSK
jgi:hypothetical protein